MRTGIVTVAWRVRGRERRHGLAVTLATGALVAIGGGVAVSPADALIRVDPVPGTGTLNAVACPTSRRCIVVGETTSYTAVVVPAPGGRPSSPEPVASAPRFGDLVGVACETRTTCFAVGQLVLGPNGSVVPISYGVPSSSDTEAEGTLTGISCGTSDTCAVVGYTNNDSPPLAMAYPLDGGILGPPVYDNAADNYVHLNGVDCVAQSECLTVGTNFVDNGIDPIVNDGLVEPYAHGALSGRQVVANYELYGVACPTATSCLAVGGNAQGGALVTISNGVPGTPVPIPGTSSLTGISCANRHRCLAVGSGTAGDGVFLRIHDGVPRIVRAISGTKALVGVACPNAVRCVASGAAPNGGGVIATLP